MKKKQQKKLFMLNLAFYKKFGYETFPFKTLLIIFIFWNTVIKQCIPVLVFMILLLLLLFWKVEIAEMYRRYCLWDQNINVYYNWLMCSLLSWIWTLYLMTLFIFTMPVYLFLYSSSASKQIKGRIHALFFIVPLRACIVHGTL